MLYFYLTLNRKLPRIIDEILLYLNCFMLRGIDCDFVLRNSLGVSDEAELLRALQAARFNIDQAVQIILGQDQRSPKYAD